MWIFDENGQFVRADGRKHIVRIDPRNGELTIYRRSEPTDEGGLLSIGRLLGTSLFADPLGGAFVRDWSIRELTTRSAINFHRCVPNRPWAVFCCLHQWSFHA